MTEARDSELSTEQSRAIAARVREELARRRISRQRLADDARISISTLEKALSGRRPFTLATTIRLEEALSAPLRIAKSAGVPGAFGLAPEALGSYSRPAVARLEGDYLTLRPSFGERGAVYAYRTEIRWDEASSSLAFRESARLDSAFTQKGAVSLPNQSGHIYMITSELGQFRLAILARPTITGELYGLLTTLQAGVGSQLIPASASIAYVPLARVPNAKFGKINSREPCYAAYRAHIDRINEESYVRFFPE
ncbi:transcriptional regulator with XRE-family HTH domain [Caulobacter ginsengisoli]|uniref:Transcriptional regulator with XRE-family HTH domain n=1 Tax=Caulobacter ginsengisoli TaxID=400775 RepID=A0ABU0IVQ9_9CAUL|nr:helix-turn-helix transcriptional regulator [Caulobacter ginsengisoli]MDQ0466104.1 transcriptional regulator with XRE-family HTH domain [Caulobacter ginsengisoli]